MIKKTLFVSLIALTAVLLFAYTPKAEAKRHSRSSTSLHVGVGTAFNDTYVTRRVARPVYVPAPVYVPQAYYAPVYAYPAPVYYEEVYVAPAPRTFGFGLSGLSFSWNFFK